MNGPTDWWMEGRTKRVVASHARDYEKVCSRKWTYLVVLIHSFRCARWRMLVVDCLLRWTSRLCSQFCFLPPCCPEEHQDYTNMSWQRKWKTTKDTTTTSTENNRWKQIQTDRGRAPVLKSYPTPKTISQLTKSDWCLWQIVKHKQKWWSVMVNRLKKL